MKQLNWYQIFGQTHTIPDGRTVTPTDDIQIWLNCADIWDKTYTTLAEVLADTDTLSALIASNNAVDYMVRSTTWAVEISVPELTGATDKATGVADAWKAFQTNESNGAQVAPGDRVIYEFDNPICVIDYHQPKVSLGLATASYTYKIQGSNDKVTWDDLETDTVANWVDGTRKALATSGLYRYVALYCVSQSGGSGHYLLKLNFYSASITADATAMTYIGQNNYCANTLLADATWLNAIANSEYIDSVLNVKNPNMTSNTTPEGEVIYSYAHSEYRPYYAFDGNLSTLCAGPNNSPTLCYFGYKFTSARKVLCCIYYPRYNHATKTRVQASADNNTWVDMSEFQECPIKDSQTKYIIPLNSPSEYQYYRCQGTVTDGNGYGMNYWEINFYGREDI